jgi:predicted PurR-regulated permease PerM
MDEILTKKVQKSRKMLAMLISVAVFGVIVYYVFLLAPSMMSEPTITVTGADSYQEYRDYISNTSKGIKNLLDGDQLKGVNLYEYSVNTENLEKNSSPFVRAF